MDSRLRGNDEVRRMNARGGFAIEGNPRGCATLTRSAWTLGVGVILWSRKETHRLV